MYKKISALILVGAIAITTGCQNDGEFTRRDAATLMGAIGGGILGSNVGKGKGRMVGAAVGALAGGKFGSWMGENLDSQSRSYHSRTTQRTLERAPIGETHEWTNPDSDTKGYITPTKTYKESDRYCREYTQKIIIGGRSQEAFGKACRNPDGTWQIVE